MATATQPNPVSPFASKIAGQIATLTTVPPLEQYESLIRTIVAKGGSDWRDDEQLSKLAAALGKTVADIAQDIDRAMATRPFFCLVLATECVPAGEPGHGKVWRCLTDFFNAPNMLDFESRYTPARARWQNREEADTAWSIYRMMAADVRGRPTVVGKLLADEGIPPGDQRFVNGKNDPDGFWATILRTGDRLFSVIRPDGWDLPTAADLDSEHLWRARWAIELIGWRERNGKLRGDRRREIVRALMEGV